MGKGEIISGGTSGQYQLKIKYDRTALEERIEAIQAKVDALNEELEEIRAQVEDAITNAEPSQNDFIAMDLSGYPEDPISAGGENTGPNGDPENIGPVPDAPNTDPERSDGGISAICSDPENIRRDDESEIGVLDAPNADPESGEDDGVWQVERVFGEVAKDPEFVRGIDPDPGPPFQDPEPIEEIEQPLTGNSSVSGTVNST